jgi:hypothetical protein
MKRVVLLVGFLMGCRSEIRPLVREELGASPDRYVEGGCSVRDYPTASDVPVNSTNVGWLRVPRQETDEATFQKLRQEVCAKGGDAMTQLRWIRAPRASVADPPIELECNAWATP